MTLNDLFYNLMTLNDLFETYSGHVLHEYG